MVAAEKALPAHTLARPLHLGELEERVCRFVAARRRQVSSGRISPPEWMVAMFHAVVPAAAATEIDAGRLDTEHAAARSSRPSRGLYESLVS